MPASMTLNYFPLPGRAEATRVALAYAGKEFEDKRLSDTEYVECNWFGKGLPVLEVIYAYRWWMYVRGRWHDRWQG